MHIHLSHIKQKKKKKICFVGNQNWDSSSWTGTVHIFLDILRWHSQLWSIHSVQIALCLIQTLKLVSVLLLGLSLGQEAAPASVTSPSTLPWTELNGITHQLSRCLQWTVNLHHPNSLRYLSSLCPCGQCPWTHFLWIFPKPQRWGVGQARDCADGLL